VVRFVRAATDAAADGQPSIRFEIAVEAALHKVQVQLRSTACIVDL
jgi:hypothetical protein